MKFVPLLALTATPALAEAVIMPGDIAYTLQEQFEEAGSWRARFLQPDLAQLGFAAVEGDLEPLCDWARDSGAVAEGATLIVSIADRAIPFGTTDPSVTQFFEAFVTTADGCALEAF